MNTRKTCAMAIAVFMIFAAVIAGTTAINDSDDTDSNLKHLTGPRTMCPHCEPPTDPDNDSIYEDVNGDGELTFEDVDVLGSRLDVLRMTKPDGNDTAYFEFSDSHGDTFIMTITDPDTIQQARDILSDRQKDPRKPPKDGDDRDDSGEPIGALAKSTDAWHPTGTITKDTAWYNLEWGYHYKPSTVSFAQISVEVCDSAIYYLQQHLDEAGGSFLPDLQWCPWSADLENEVVLEPTGPYVDMNQDSELTGQDLIHLANDVVRYQARNNGGPLGDTARQHRNLTPGNNTVNQ